MKHPGVERLTLKNQAAGFSKLIKIMRGEKIEEQKKRKEYVRKNLKNDMREKQLEKTIILRLNLYEHIIAWKVGDTSTYNSQYTVSGIADIEGFNFKTREKFYIEVKDPYGIWRNSQIAFMGLCVQMNIKYILAFTLNEAIDGVV